MSEESSALNISYKLRRPVFFICAAFMAGVVTAQRWDVSPLALFISILVLIGVLFALFRYGQRNSFVPGTCLLILMAVSVGAARYEWFEQHCLQAEREVFHACQSGQAELTGTLDGMPKKHSRWRGVSFPLRNVRVQIQDEVIELSRRVLVYCYFPLDRTPDFNDRVYCSAKLKPIRSVSVPGQRDRKDWFDTENIHATVRVYRPSGLEFTKPEHFSLRAKFHRCLFELRQNILENFRCHLKDPWWQMLASIFLGERTLLPGFLEENMFATGTYHITAVSGLHVTLVVGSLLLGLKLIGLKRRIAALAVLPMLLVFLGLVGYRTPAIRATILGYGLLIGLLVKRDVDLLNMLAVSALAILVVKPGELLQVGFQLSFMTVTGFALFLPRVNDLVKVRAGVVRRLWQAFCVSTIAWLAAVPVLACHFGEFTLIAPLANLIIVPIVWLVMMGGILMPAFGSAMGFLAGYLGFALECLLSTIAHLSHWFANVPGSRFDVPYPSFHFVAGYYLLLLVATAQRDQIELQFKRLKIHRHQFVLMALCCLVWIHGFRQESGLLHCYFLEMGHGDCTLIRTPGGGCLLVDGGRPRGKSAREGNTNLVKAMRYLGVSKIDCMVLTHPDIDHIGELKSVLESFPVGLFLTSPSTDEIKAYRELLTAVEAEPLSVRRVQAGYTIEGFPEVSLKIISPTWEILADGAYSDNEASVVILLTYKDMDVLLTGDATEETERILVGAFDLESEILKVAHHGSKFSSCETFLREVCPEISVIPCGKNAYGHPHPEALERLTRNSGLVLRNDLDGTVEIITNGETYRVLCWKHRKRYADIGSMFN